MANVATGGGGPSYRKKKAVSKTRPRRKGATAYRRTGYSAGGKLTLGTWKPAKKKK